MTQNDREILTQAILMAATFYGAEIDRNRLSSLLNYWGSTQVAPPTISAAYRRFMDVSKLHKFPAPFEIMQIIRPRAEAQDIGVLTAAKVTQAVSKFGYNNGKEAFEFIGPLGVAAVRVFGGWEYVCEQLGVTIDVTTFQAQVRELVKSEVKSNAMGQSYLGIEHKKENEQVASPEMRQILAKCKPKEF